MRQSRVPKRILRELPVYELPQLVDREVKGLQRHTQVCVVSLHLLAVVRRQRVRRLELLGPGLI